MRIFEDLAIWIAGRSLLQEDKAYGPVSQAQSSRVHRNQQPKHRKMAQSPT
jgi:hypothetical protein